MGTFAIGCVGVKAFTIGCDSVKSSAVGCVHMKALDERPSQQESICIFFTYCNHQSRHLLFLSRTDPNSLKMDQCEWRNLRQFANHALSEQTHPSGIIQIPVPSDAGIKEPIINKV